MKRIPGLLLAIIVMICVVQCAKKGNVEGGPIDEDPPEFVRANPENFTTNFEEDEIRIYFNEYIKLDKPQQQIIISPPMDPKPSILPLGSARKDVKIEIFDTLEENTTYTINFGKSIVDNNESNPFPYFKYVFSTGDYIDSLEIAGAVKIANQKEPKENVSIFLYPADTTYSDSIIYKKTPRYVTYSQDSTHIFRLENLKAGDYKLVAIWDKNDNYLYNPKSEYIGFVEETISIPTDSIFGITLFKEELNFTPKRPSQLKGNQILFGYEGFVDMDSVEIELLSEKPVGYETRLIKDAEKDSLYYWYNIKPELDSLIFEVRSPKTRDTLILPRFVELDRDSISVTAEPSSTINIEQNYMLKSNTPIVDFSEELISIKRGEDSTDVPFNSIFDRRLNRIVLQFNKEPAKSYKVTTLPGAITDIFNESNDTIRSNLKTKPLDEFGTVILNIQNLKSLPAIIQLTDLKGAVIAEKYIEEGSTITFRYINPANILVKVLYDENGNGKWDTGNFFKKQQAELIEYYRDTLEVRPNWDLNEAINVN